MITLLFITAFLLYITQLQPAWRQWQATQQQLNNQHSQAQQLKASLQQCGSNSDTLKKKPIIFQHYLQQQLSPSTLNHNMSAMDNYFKKNQLTLENYTPIDNKDNKHSLIIYRYCGTYNNIIQTLANWNQQTFFAWISQISLEHCPNKSHQLQLTLALDASYE